MKRDAMLGGIGGIAFAVLTMAGFMVASPPGGDYSAQDITDFLADGHRTSVFAGFYLGLLGVAGLLLLLAHLRDAARTGGSAALRRVFWSAGIVGAAAFALGWAVMVVAAASQSLGGAPAVDGPVAYAITQAGELMLFGTGGVMLGVALVALSFAAAAAVPAWVRWLTLVCGLLGLASMAWFPFFALLVWAIVVGVWLTVARREPAGVAATA